MLADRHSQKNRYISLPTLSLYKTRNNISMSGVHDSGTSFSGLFYLLSLVYKSDSKGNIVGVIAVNIFDVG